MVVVEGRRRLRWALALLVVAGAWLGMAQAAQAGEVQRSGNTLRYVDTDTSNNAVIMWYCTTANTCTSPDPSGGDHFLIGDNGDTITAAAGSNCVPWSPNPSLLTCPKA